MSSLEIQTPSGPVVLDEGCFAAEARTVDSSDPLPRLAFAATHLVMHESYASIQHSVEAPGAAEEIAEHIDWTTTMDLRRSIGSHGMGIAEAMDTAQRFSLRWGTASELIARTGELRLPAGFCAGASSDHLDGVASTNDLIDGVVKQIHFIHDHGGIPVILPMPTLSENRSEPEKYVGVYREIARQAPNACPLFVHWLGPMFLPSLEGYFPGDSFEEIMRAEPETFRGAKLSMLDDALECRLRKTLLERDQIMLTGDDFHFGGLIAGDNTTERTTTIAGRTVNLGDFSHALLGIFDAIAEPAALAMRCLGQGDREAYERIMEPCEALGQVIFEEPSRFYKSGLAFLGWLNGAQANPMLVNHEERYRDTEHLMRVVRRAAEAGAIRNVMLAAERLEQWLASKD